MKKYQFEIASEQEEAQLRRILRETPMKGKISVVFAREPNYFAAAAIEGEHAKTVVAKTAVGEIVGMGSHSLIDCYINRGQKQLGYLSQLRVQRDYHGDVRILSGGYKKIKEFMEDSGVPVAITTVIHDNTRVRNLLTSRKLGLPVYRECGELVTLCIPLKKILFRNKHLSKGYRIMKGSKAYQDEILRCLREYGQEKLFYPVYTKEIIEGDRSPGLDWGHFYMALSGNKVVGVTAPWDQSSIKQSMVHSYSGTMKVIKPIMTPIAKLLRMPPLPVEGEVMKYITLSHTAVKDNDKEIFQELFQAIYSDYLNKDYHYVMACFSQSDPLLDPLLAYHPMKYKSVVYLVSWDEGLMDAYHTDQVAYMEISRL